MLKVGHGMMRPLLRARYFVIPAIVCATVVGCGAQQAGSAKGQDQGSSRSAPEATPVPSNDAALSTAADSLEPYLRSSYPDTYAGMKLDQAAHRMLVYRRPGTQLDASVDERTDVTVVFRDATYSLSEMDEVAKAVVKDAAHWKKQGVEVNGAGPRSDGTAISS